MAFRESVAIDSPNRRPLKVSEFSFHESVTLPPNKGMQLTAKSGLSFAEENSKGQASFVCS